jgi:hypothetical protein
MMKASARREAEKKTFLRELVYDVGCSLFLLINISLKHLIINLIPHPPHGPILVLNSPDSVLVYVEKIIVKLFYYALSEKKDSTTSDEVEAEKSKKR